MLVKVKIILYLVISILFQHLYNVNTGFSGGGLAVIVFSGLNALDTSFSLIEESKKFFGKGNDEEDDEDGTPSDLTT